MPLNLMDSTASSSTYLPIVKVNGISGLISCPLSDGSVHHVTPPWRCVMDFAAIQQRWIVFPQTGGHPLSWPMLDNEGKQLPRPVPTAENQRQDKEGNSQYPQKGFEILTYSNDKAANGEVVGLRRWRSNSFSANGAMISVYDSWEEQQSQHSGQLAVVSVTPTPDTAKGNRAVFIPHMKIESWIEREKIPGLNDASVVQDWLDALVADIPPQVLNGGKSAEQQVAEITEISNDVFGNDNEDDDIPDF